MSDLVLTYMLQPWLEETNILRRRTVSHRHRVPTLRAAVRKWMRVRRDNKGWLTPEGVLAVTVQTAGGVRVANVSWSGRCWEAVDCGCAGMPQGDAREINVRDFDRKRREERRNALRAE
jgi:hypothetical protein